MRDPETQERACAVCGASGMDIEERDDHSAWTCIPCGSSGSLHFKFKRWSLNGEEFVSPMGSGQVEDHCPSCASMELVVDEDNLGEDNPWTNVSCKSCGFEGEREYSFGWAAAHTVTAKGERLAAEDEEANSV